MSLSNPKSSTSPVQKYLEWKGSTGRFSYYDKEAAERVEMPEKFYMVVLDQLSTVRGFNRKLKTGIRANEVRNLQKEELHVRYSSGGDITKGYWSAIKDKVSVAGGKFAKAVYAALIVINKDKSFSTELVKLDIYGSSIFPFIEAKIGDGGEIITVSTNPTPRTDGDNDYLEPIFQKGAVRQDVLGKCIALDRELQAYFDSRGAEALEQEAVSPAMPQLNAPVAEVVAKNATTAIEQDNDLDELPF